MRCVLIAPQAKIESLERLLVLVGLLEDRARAPAFDYSATQLLASWLQDILSGFPVLAAATEKLIGLSQSVKTIRGLGQAQIWTSFRDDHQLNPDTLQILDLIAQVTDPCKCPCVKIGSRLST
jgi:hypothetical protein